MTDPYEIWTNRVIAWMGTIPVLVYIIVALFLTIVAIISLGMTFLTITAMFSSANWEIGIINVIYAILLTVIIVELFETVTVYLRTRRVPVRAILIAGLTALIRHVIVMNLTEFDPVETTGLAILIAVFIGGIFLLRDDGHSPILKLN
jgi:uncharacterized membrane protein (DUF373 family)